MGDYSKLPAGSKAKVTPFTAHIPDDRLNNMLDLVRLSPIGPASYENEDKSRLWGMNREWLSKAKDQWSNSFDWRKQEKRINSFPNFTIPVNDEDGVEYTMHFIALFSENEKAIPVVFYHGWPGSILEFLGMLDVIKSKYSPSSLPYHIIVPSLPGYTFSSGPPTTKDASRLDMSRICWKLMHELGFGDGYIAQGGDLGSQISRLSAEHDEACKAFHINLILVNRTSGRPENADDLPIDNLEAKVQQKGSDWLEFGTAYGQEHGTRTGTIGLVLSASPIAMLAWIGEKFLEWSDTDPSVEDILASVSLYWLTDTFPRCIYPYRSMYGPHRKEIAAASKPKHPNHKPMGFSWFPHELVATPVSWAATTGNLVYHKRHTSGGHFAAFEKPQELFEDVEEFVKVAWK